jgi:hypothetical protein
VRLLPLRVSPDGGGLLGRRLRWRCFERRRKAAPLEVCQTIIDGGERFWSDGRKPVVVGAREFTGVHGGKWAWHHRNWIT